MNALHWRVLWTIHDARGVIGFDLIAWCAKIDRVTLARVLVDLMDASKHNGESLIEKCKDGYVLSGVRRDGEASTGGYKAIEESCSSPFLEQLNDARWVDEVSSGMRYDGRQTKVTRAVVPECMRKSR